MRLTRSGWSLLVVGGATLVVARTIQFPEIWVLGTGLISAVLFALVAMVVDRHAISVNHHVEPAEVSVGIPAQIVVDMSTSPSRGSRAATVLIGDTPWRVPALRSGVTHRFTVDFPTQHRGVVTLPAIQIRRTDPLGLVERTRIVGEPIDVVISPRTEPLDMVRIGVGSIGSLLGVRARQFGVGDFEGLRHYVEGDDLRLVHWKASARSDELLVKQFAVDGAHRFAVVLDTSTPVPAEAFETGVSVAASLVMAAHHHGLAVRFATTGGVDIRGDTTRDDLRRTLASLIPHRDLTVPVRDPSDSLGLAVCVIPHLDSLMWQQRERFTDPLTVTFAAVTAGPDLPRDDRTIIEASTCERFAQRWNRLVGQRESAGSAPW